MLSLPQLKGKHQNNLYQRSTDKLSGGVKLQQSQKTARRCKYQLLNFSDSTTNIRHMKQLKTPHTAGVQTNMIPQNTKNNQVLKRVCSLSRPIGQLSIDSVATHQRQVYAGVHYSVSEEQTKALQTNVAPRFSNEIQPIQRSQDPYVTFRLKFNADYGCHVRLVGSGTKIGDWNYENGLVMKWTNGDVWEATVQLQPGIFEYKYMVVGADGRQAAAWQQGNNSVLAISVGDKNIQVSDNWEGNPGAAVTHDGRLSTREESLFQWAKDLQEKEKQLHSTQVELDAINESLTIVKQQARQDRMALAQAQEQLRVTRKEAVEAQQEAKFLREINKQLETDLDESRVVHQNDMVDVQNALQSLAASLAQ